jgi:hypothetical protein
VLNGALATNITLRGSSRAETNFFVTAVPSATIGGTNLIEGVNQDGTKVFQVGTNGDAYFSGTITATNSLAVATNYAAANMTPVQGLVKLVGSNNVLFAVTTTTTNVLPGSGTVSNAAALTLNEPIIGQGNGGIAATGTTAFINLFGNGGLLLLSTNNGSSLTNLQSTNGFINTFIFNSQSNTLTMNNAGYVLNTYSNFSITNITGNASGSFLSWASLVVSNRHANNITGYVTVPNIRIMGTGSTNGLIVPTGKTAIFTLLSWGNTITNYWNMLQQ